MRNTVLIVDDVIMNRDILSGMLEDRFDILEAEDGIIALSLIEKNKNELAAILLDLTMPRLDGFGVLERLRGTELMSSIPVLVISGETSAESERRCLDYGVVDFIHKPFDATLVLRRVKNSIELFAYKNRLEEQVAEQTETLRRQNLELREQARLLEENNRAVIDMLGTVVESRSHESGTHIQRVKGYTAILAAEMMRSYPEYGLTDRIIDLMVSASVLHDLGKISIPDSILLKPGRLTAEEFDEMKLHTVRGSDIIISFDGAWNSESRQLSYDICRYHHERYDGRGYPDRLAGDDIPVSAQIVSIADVFDALTTKRVYKDAYPTDEASRMILEGECGVFSPKLLDCFRKAGNELVKLVR